MKNTVKVQEASKYHTHLKKIPQPGMVAHACNLSTWEAEAGGFPSSRPAWSTE